MEDIIDFVDSKDRSSIIKIVGIGGGGCNAAEYLYKQGISDVDFLVCNTDLMALNESPIQDKVQLGVSASEGNGAGNNAKNGEMAAIENLDDIIESIGESTKMIFLTAGMGGGTGTGATPVIAKAAKHKGILTVAIVTRPFRFEGPKRLEQAQRGIDKLKEYVDSLIIIDNERLKL